MWIGLPDGWAIPGLGFKNDTDLDLTITLVGATIKDGTEYELKHATYENYVYVEKSGENTLRVYTKTDYDNTPDPMTWDCTIHIPAEDLIVEDGYEIPSEGISIPFKIQYSTP